MIAGNWILEPSKFLNRGSTGGLLDTASFKAEQASQSGKKVAIRDHFVVHLALSTGLRVMEIAALKCGDLFLENRVSSVVVRKGKGGRKRLVFLTGPFRQHCRSYLKWKERMGESVKPDAPLILSSNTGRHMTTRALQKVFKRCAKQAGLPESYSIHCLRHTYACFLLKASNWNLRLVQKQLGHARISTTQVYADVMMPDMEKALNRLWY